MASRGYWTLFLLDAATSLGFALLILLMSMVMVAFAVLTGYA